MKFVPNKKYYTIACYCIIVFAVCLGLIIVVFKFDTIREAADKILAVCSPITWGVVIAYLLNPGMVYFDKLFNKLVGKKKPHPRTSRCLSIAVMSVIAVAVITALILIILPQITESIASLINNMPEYLQGAEVKTNELIDNNPQLFKLLNNTFFSIDDFMSSLVSDLKPMLSNALGQLTTTLKSLVIGVKDFAIGFIVSIYLLYSKETFIAQMRKLIHAIFPEKICHSILEISSEANTTLTKFISGKALDSLIIGILCFIGVTILRMPFALLISVIIGITNMIPFFGPFFGAVPTALLIFIEDPLKALIFVIFILALQQFDGNILGPKILGDSTGLPAFWVMFAIILGGGLFGFVGMLLCVPVFALLYSFSRKIITSLLLSRKMPAETSRYASGEAPIAFPQDKEQVPAKTDNESAEM